MKIQIEPYQQQSGMRLKTLAARTFEDEDYLDLLKTPRCEFAYSAYVDGIHAALMVGWKSSFHPNCTYFKTFLDPEIANEELLGSLLEEAEQQEGLLYPLQTSIWETAAALKSVYESKGFTEIRRTYMPALSLSNVSLESALVNEFDGHVVLSIAQLPAGGRGELVALVKRIYEETHEVNPPAEHSAAEWKTLVFADDMVAEGSFVCIDSKTRQITAYSFLHVSEKEGVYELGWCGCREETDLSILRRLVAHQLQHSASQHIHTIEGEFDTTDPYAMEVMKRFPFAPCPAWVTYQKRR